MIDVACGSGDAATIVVTESGSVFGFGDGDYGKLGVGGSDASRVPKQIVYFTVSCFKITNIL